MFVVAIATVVAGCGTGTSDEAGERSTRSDRPERDDRAQDTLEERITAQGVVTDGPSPSLGRAPIIPKLPGRWEWMQFRDGSMALMNDDLQLHINLISGDAAVFDDDNPSIERNQKPAVVFGCHDGVTSQLVHNGAATRHVAYHAEVDGIMRAAQYNAPTSSNTDQVERLMASARLPDAPCPGSAPRRSDEPDE